MSVRQTFSCCLGATLFIGLVVSGELRFAARRGRLDETQRPQLWLSALAAGIGAGLVANRFTRKVIRPAVVSFSWCVLGAIFAPIRRANGDSASDLWIVCASMFAGWLLGLIVRAIWIGIANWPLPAIEVLQRANLEAAAALSSSIPAKGTVPGSSNPS